VTDRSDLERRFHDGMVDIYRRAKLECRYNATYFIRMVGDDGGLATARRLLHAKEPSAGYVALYECGRLDLTVEALVLLCEWEDLISHDDRRIARERLTDYGFNVDAYLTDRGCGPA
jgi:hypothetical protein